jgi:acyl carrier protein
MGRMNDILEEVNKIFMDVLDNDSIVVSNETTADVIAEWDSLTHIQLIVAIEKHFHLTFTSAEIEGWKNVGNMCVSIKGAREK